jgi:hypothetical protein
MNPKTKLPELPDITLENALNQSTEPSVRIDLGVLLTIITFILGIASGYFLWGYEKPASSLNAAIYSQTAQIDTDYQVADIIRQINPPEGYTLPISYSDIGPQLLAAGAIDYDQFVRTYQQTGKPLTQDQLIILREGSDAPVVINKENAYFLLNFFWAFGLTNENSLLKEGPMMHYSEGQIGRFASTGGWTIGSQPATELYSSTVIITLTEAQQTRVEQVASAVYRPCCNNPTSFPDCNHGMAMLGLLELMASQDASIIEMFEAAKYVNAFWFPQQTLEMAMFFIVTEGLDFALIDAREITGPDFSAGAGFQQVHQWLVARGLLEQAPRDGSGCGV